MKRLLTALLITTTLSACAGDGFGPSISSVPGGVPSLDNDRAAQSDSRLKEERVEALAARMETLRLVDGQVVEENLDEDGANSQQAEADNTQDQMQTVHLGRTESAQQTAVKKQTVSGENVAKSQPAKTAEKAAPAMATEKVSQQVSTIEIPSLQGQPIYLTEIDFGLGKKVLDGSDKAQVAKVVNRLLAKNIQGTFVVEGYASKDSKRSTKVDIMNMKLSLARANALASTLAELGVPRERLRIQAMGQTNPHNLAGNKARAVLWVVQ